MMLVLVLACCGSATMAYLNHVTHVQLPPLQFATDLHAWRGVEGSQTGTFPDVVCRMYSSRTASCWIIVRRSRHLRRLHDLTSCLIANDAHPVAAGQLQLSAVSGSHAGQLVRYRLKGRNYLALFWFQSQDVTATNPWKWRWLSIANGKVRSRPVFYQAEVAVMDSGNTGADLTVLQEIGAKVFDQIKFM